MTLFREKQINKKRQAKHSTTEYAETREVDNMADMCIREESNHQVTSSQIQASVKKNRENVDFESTESSTE